MKKFAFLALASVVLPCATAVAQPVSVSGRLVIPFVQPATCGVGVSVYQLENTEVYVVSTSIVLDPFVGKDVQIAGPLTPAFCFVVDAQTVVAAPYTLETCGGGALGCPTRINLVSNGGSSFALFASLNNGFLPAGPNGTFLLDPLAATILVVAPENQGNVTTLDFVIPVDPAIQAISVKLQAARAATSLPGNPIQFSTVGSIFTGTFTTPCHIPGC